MHAYQYTDIYEYICKYMYIRIYRRDGGVDVDSLKQSVLECVTNGDPMVVFVTIEAIPALFEQGNRMAIMALVSLWHW